MVYNDSSYIEHNLPSPFVCGPFPTKTIKIPADKVYSQYSVLGEKTKDTIAGVADGGNTGDGTIGSLSFGKLAIPGVYNVECITAVSDAGVFKVVDPNGVKLDKEVTVAVAYTSDHVNLTIADGAADFVVGDKFAVTIAAPSDEEYILSEAASVDGSEKAKGILAEAIDTTGAAKDAVIYIGGVFSDSGLVFGTGHTIATTDEDMRKEGVFLEKSTQ